MLDGYDYSGFAREVERAATALLDDGKTEDELIQTARVVQEMAETALARNRNDGHLIACGPGCGHCCVVNVAVLLPEAVTVVAYLERKLSPERIEGLRQKIDRLYASIRWLDDEERLMLRRPCAFLADEGSCDIYPVRPLLCRAVTSIDAETCRQAVVLHPLGEAPPITANLFQSELFNQAFLALARAMENVGLDSRSRPLTEAVKTLLDQRYH